MSLVTQASTRRVSALPQDSTIICQLLEAARCQSAKTNTPIFFARKFIGKPYVAHTLEINDKEQLVVNTREMDCTTLVETVTALTICVNRHQYTWRDYLNTLTALRYRDGRIDTYTSRIHYFSEWITSNTKAGFVEEIQAPKPPFSGVQKVSVSYMSEHPENYKVLRNHPEFVSEIRQMEQRVSGGVFRYIPKSLVGNAAMMRKAVRDGDIIAITCNKKGLDIAHLGFAVWKNGELHLLNASQLHKKVVEEPMTLSQYLRKHSSHIGIRIIRIK